MEEFEVACLGSAIVDVFIEASDDDLRRLGLARSSMTLVGREVAMEVATLHVAKEVKSGGSAANTAAALANLGVSTTFCGLFDNDELGERFSQEMREAGVSVFREFESPNLGTGRCLVFVTDDGERTMATYLGSASAINGAIVETYLERPAKVLYVEGYLLEVASVFETLRHLAPDLRRRGVKVVLSLSDRYLVERIFGSLLDLLKVGVITNLLGNEGEFEALMGVSDVRAVAETFLKDGFEGAITCGGEGVIGFGNGEIVEVPADTSGPVVDTTGAGDLFASGYLYGLVRGKGLRSACEIGVACATEVISHFGARPERSLIDLIEPYLGSV
ncbi:Sugar or nucleoside kinase, ribokinase family [Ferrithrix thermotolerans DSM 19514]|uniref:Sugar or nucleoside kinase, ribokinase family n=1 Tax=Ferrithrix thermotolerans DSM 19514 TaxID=1121881 RepID=A0A1M4XVF9_9ACTN|nr:adenosine kinase [Ferrithrix thermotolerans]SHE97420.1 Sugar or nucleoside kinase, ribokinase family [Ferrithrix thermotolerans DSM 19514]